MTAITNSNNYKNYTLCSCAFYKTSSWKWCDKLQSREREIISRFYLYLQAVLAWIILFILFHNYFNWKHKNCKTIQKWNNMNPQIILYGKHFILLLNCILYIFPILYKVYHVLFQNTILINFHNSSGAQIIKFYPVQNMLFRN